MPQISRLGDKDSANHAIDKGVSTNVFVNGIQAATVGSRNQVNETASTGSSSVFINGKAVHRTGDRIEPHVSIEGSPNVFAG